MSTARRMLLVLLSGCMGKDPEPESRLVLERFPCLGTCPSYRLTIKADGTVHYDGQGYLSTLLAEPPQSARRRETARISREDAESVITAFDRTWSDWWPNQYRPLRFTCPGAGTDSRSLVIVRQRGVRRDSIAAYYGCPYVPARISRLGAYVDSIVGVERWLGPVPPR